MARYSKIILLGFFILILFHGCANQLPPSGGEPDTIPPEVTGVYPLNGTTNFTDNYLEIEFSEYVKRNNAREAVFISPTIQGDIEYSWSGKTLAIEFDEPLKPNTTYTVTAGSDFEDENNRNKLAEPFVFAFSTGERIDNGKISGKVFDKNPSGIVVIAYRMNDSIPNPKTDKPDYISQAGANGEFRLMGLAPDNYRVFALRDDFKDFLYKVEQDEYSAPPLDIALSLEDSLFENLYFKMAKEDSTLPELTNATMTDRYHILLEFSEFIDSTRVEKSKITVIDSVSGTYSSPVYFYKGNATAKQYYIVLGDSLDIENDYTISIKDFYDYEDNYQSESGISFVASDRPDTTAAEIIRTVTNFDKNLVDYEHAFVEVYFNDGFNQAAVKPAIKFVDQNDKELGINTKFPDDASLRVELAQKLEPRSKYRLLIDLSKLSDLAGNKLDSLHTIEVTSSSELDFSGISGKITGIYPEGNLIVVAEEAAKKSTMLQVAADSTGVYEFRQVKPGKYLVWVYGDKNSNNKYDNGGVDPFSYAEEFSYFRDTLNLRPRWPVGDVDIKF